MSATSLRLITMLKLIPRRGPGITCRQVQDRLEDRGHTVSLRTIQRDLERLSELFPLVSDEGHPAHWSWMRGAADESLPAHDPFSALTWQLIEEYLKPLLPRTLQREVEPQFKAARQFLRQSGAHKLARWRARVRMLPRALHLHPPEIVPEVLDAVYEGLLDGRKVAVDYRSRGANESRRLTLNPLALVVRESVYYLLVTIDPFDDVRQTVLHRMAKAEVLGDRIREPARFDLETYISEGHFQYGTGKKIRLVCRFDPDAAQHLLESPLSEDQQVQDLPDGRIEISATVLHSNQLTWWLLGFGGNVEVVRPKPLRADIVRELETLREHYSAGQGRTRQD